MISDKHQCVFIHIPKTGGQSVESVFLALNGLSWETRAPLLLRPNEDPARGPERLAHLKAREYVACGHIGRRRFDRYFKFAFVRNPWDRLVSEYRYCQLEDDVPFRAFVEERFGETDDNRATRRHVIPQVEFLTDERGDFIVDFIGRFEHFQQDFSFVAGKLGLEGAVLPHRNPSKGNKASRLRRLLRPNAAQEQARPTYQSYYDDGLRRRVGDFYAEDIERFTYSFDGGFGPDPILSKEREEANG